MATHWNITESDVTDLIQGATFLGAGGGGSPDNAHRIANDAFDALDGGQIPVLAPESLDDERTIVTGGMGAPESSKGPEAREEVFAIKAYEDVLGEPVETVMPFEIGAGNLLRPIRAAAALDRPILDADGAGRAVPELQMASFALAGVDIAPMALADWERNSALLFPNDIETGERMSRALTVEFGSSAGFACYPMSGATVREAVIPGTVSRTLDVGHRINEAKGTADPATAVADLLDGEVLVRGSVTDVASETRAGFDIGCVTVDGDVRVDVKNENMIVWRDNEPLALAPDLICWLSEDGDALTNADVEVGRGVTIVAAPAPDVWQTPEGIALFEPILKIFDWEEGYVPLTELRH